MTDRTELLRAVAERAPAFPVFVYGPAGWGKTTYAEAFRQHFGKTRIIDDWTWRDPMPPGNALVLTQDLPPPLTHAVPIADALRLIVGRHADPRLAQERARG